MRRPTPQQPIDAKVSNRLNWLEWLIDTEYGGSSSKFEEKTGIKMAQVSQWFTGYRALRDKALKRLEQETGKPDGWFDRVFAPQNKAEERPTSGRITNKERDIVIDQFDAGGGMGRSRLILRDQPGIIKSWHVDHDWLRLNVRQYTSVENLKIVTGFGPSMKPMFNPGDPLLVDIGVNSIDQDGVFFYRTGDDFYIKTLERVPQDGGGRLIRARSKNTDMYPDPVMINEKTMDFHVLAKVLTIWKSDQF